ncbi:MAG: hypothetical protein Q4G71_11085 [Pseudomonadota bacterium]|nr:hypothetical protein [Pseudomonadota bacterium]
MSTRRPLAPWLLAAALLLFWACLLVAGRLAPRQADETLLTLDAAQAAAVRRVVLDWAQPQHPQEPVARFDVLDDPTLRVRIRAPGQRLPGVALVVQGDTLFVRHNASAAVPGAAAGKPAFVGSVGIEVPAYVTTLQARRSSVRVRTARALPGLALHAESLNDFEGPVDSLRVHGLPDADCRARFFDLRLDAQQVRRLWVSAPNHSVDIRGTAALAALSIEAPHDVPLKVDHIAATRLLQWTPTPLRAHCDAAASPPPSPPETENPSPHAN